MVNEIIARVILVEDDGGAVIIYDRDAPVTREVMTIKKG